ncbi:hypothetical protein FF1_026433 [Malus domestica]
MAWIGGSPTANSKHFPRYAPFKDLFVLKRQLPALNLHISYLNSPCHENFTIVLTVGSCFDSPDDLVLLLKTWQSTREHPLGRWSDEYAMHLYRRFVVLPKFQNQTV